VTSSKWIDDCTGKASGSETETGATDAQGDPEVEKNPLNLVDTDLVCFVAGTLVHTKNGLMPIEQIKAGDLVLSQPEAGGERAYGRVTLTSKRSDQEVLLLEYFRADATNDPSEIKNLVLTAQHPVWVSGIGWVAARALDGGNEIQLADGSPGLVLTVRQILMTDVPQVGWTHDDGIDLGPTIDLRDHSILISEFFKGDTYNESAFELNMRFKADVYNFEVEDLHTYYVGEAGVWVHNICPTGASPMGTTGEWKVSYNDPETAARFPIDPDPLSFSQKPVAG
jgi:hypothetical protein